MNEHRKDARDCFVIEGKMALPNQYFAGRVGSKFIIALRDQRKMLGVKCPQCNQVYIPPREYCEKDLTRIDEKWIELGNEGIVTNYTVVRYSDSHLPKKVPYIIAMIKVDGADTPLTHIVEGIEPEQIKVGLRVRPVFAERESSTIMNIEYFEPVDYPI